MSRAMCGASKPHLKTGRDKGVDETNGRFFNGVNLD
jgi:hypothetical protein